MNAYSILHNFDQPVYTPDFQFVSMALGYKQQKLDVNRQKIQSLYDHFSNLDVSKDVHKEYIDGRLKQILDINRNYHSMDLSDDNFASVVAGNVTQLMDDIVKGAVMDTRIIRAEDKEWEDQRLNFDPKKGGGKYNDLNREYALAMSDRGAYQQDKELGRRYKGGAGFIEYVDYNKKFLDNIDGISKRLNATFITEGPNAGQFRTIDKYEVVDPNKLRSEIERLFDPRDRKQMQIDAWGQYKDNPQGFARAWNSNVESTTNAIEKQIQVLEAGMSSNTLTKSEKEVAQQQLEVLKSRAAQTKEQRFENIIQQGVRPEDLYGQLYTENYIESIVQTYAKQNLVDRKLDAAWAENVKLNQRIYEFNMDMNYKKEKDLGDRLLKLDELNMKAAKEGLVRDPQTGQWVKAGGAFGANVPGVFQGVYDLATSIQEAEGNQDPFDNLLNESKQALTTITGTVQSVFGINYNLRSASMKELVQGLTSGGNEAVKFNPDGTATITIDKRTKTVSAEELKVLTENAFKTTFESQPLKEFYTGVSSTVDYINESLGQMFSTGRYAPGGDLDRKGETPIPNLAFKIVEEKDGVFVMKPFEQGENGHTHYKNLLRKKHFGGTLTAAEEKTLQVYGAYSLYLDNSVGDKERKGIDAYIRSEVLPTIKTDKNLLPQTWRERQNTSFTTKNNQLEDTGLSSGTLTMFKQTLFPNTPEGQHPFVATNTSYINETERGKQYAEEIFRLLKTADGLPQGNSKKKDLVAQAAELRVKLHEENLQYRNRNTNQTQYTGSNVLSISGRESRVQQQTGTVSSLGSVGNTAKGMLETGRANAEAQATTNLTRNKVVGIQPGSPYHTFFVEQLTGTGGGIDRDKALKGAVMLIDQGGGNYLIAQDTPGSKNDRITNAKGFDKPISYTNSRIITERELREAGVNINPQGPNYLPGFSPDAKETKTLSLGYFNPANIALEQQNGNILTPKDIKELIKPLPENTGREIENLYKEFVEGNIILSLMQANTMGSGTGSYATLNRKVNGQLQPFAFHYLGEGVTAEDLNFIQGNKLTFMHSIFAEFLSKEIQ
jgi:hypothetical protein